MRPLQFQPFSSHVSNASFTTSPIDMRQMFNISLQVVAAAGSCAGTFQIQVSNLPVKSEFIAYAPAPEQWTNLGTPLTFAQGSAASSQLLPKIDMSYVAMRIVFTDTSSGSNTALVTANLAGLGD